MCTPLNAKCGGCPIKGECTARALQSKITQDEVGAIADIEDLCSKCEATPEGQNVQVTDFPLKVKKQEVPRVTDVVCVVKFKPKNLSSSKDAKTRVLIRKRPAKGVTPSYVYSEVAVPRHLVQDSWQDSGTSRSSQTFHHLQIHLLRPLSLRHTN